MEQPSIDMANAIKTFQSRGGELKEVLFRSNLILRLAIDVLTLLRHQTSQAHNPRTMRRRPIKPISQAQLERLPTHRLLARLKQLHQCQESLSLSDHAGEQNVTAEIFKDSPEWIAAYEQIKRILAKREHID